MNPITLLVVAAAIVLVAVIGQRKGWVDLSNKRSSGGGGGIMSIGDEVFSPTRHEAQVELDRQTVLPAPAPTPGDGDRGIYSGTIRIRVGDAADARDAAA